MPAGPISIPAGSTLKVPDAVIIAVPPFPPDDEADPPVAFMRIPDPILSSEPPDTVTVPPLPLPVALALNVTELPLNE